MFGQKLEWGNFIRNRIRSYSLKTVLFFLTFALLLTSCSNEYAVEDELYSHLENEFSKQSLDLEKSLDTLEKLCIEDGILLSTSPSDYRQYYQNNIDQGMLLFIHCDYYNEIMNKVNLRDLDLERCALRKFNGEAFDESKFGKISNLIKIRTKETGQISSGTVAEAHLEVLSDEDFEHPFYRAGVLLSLQHLYFNRYMSGDRKHIRPIPKKIDY